MRSECTPSYGGRYEVEPLEADTVDARGRRDRQGRGALRRRGPVRPGRPAAFNGAWVIGEIEITEPGLYIDVDPGIAEAYVDAIVATLRR